MMSKNNYQGMQGKQEHGFLYKACKTLAILGAIAGIAAFIIFTAGAGPAVLGALGTAFGAHSAIGGAAVAAFGPKSAIGGWAVSTFGANSAIGGWAVNTFGANSTIGGGIVQGASAIGKALTGGYGAATQVGAIAATAGAGLGVASLVGMKIAKSHQKNQPYNNMPYNQNQFRGANDGRGLAMEQSGFFSRSGKANSVGSAASYNPGHYYGSNVTSLDYERSIRAQRQRDTLARY